VAGPYSAPREYYQVVQIGVGCGLAAFGKRLAKPDISSADFVLGLTCRLKKRNAHLYRCGLNLCS